MSDRGLGPLLLTLQLTDSSFPSGLYTLSHGLEGLVQRGEVDAATVAPVLHGMLRHSVGPGDATALALAWRAVHDSTEPSSGWASTTLNSFFALCAGLA